LVACAISLIAKDVVKDSAAAVRELNLFSVEVRVGNCNFLLVLGSDLSLTGAKGSPYIEAVVNIASTLNLSLPSSAGVVVARCSGCRYTIPMACAYCGTMAVRIQIGYLDTKQTLYRLVKGPVRGGRQTQFLSFAG
jgi:hypothetical protein